MNSPGPADLPEIAKSVLKQGREYPEYFYGFPALYVLWAVVTWLILNLLKGPFFQVGSPSAGQNQVSGLLFTGFIFAWVLLIYFPMLLTQTRIASRSAEESPEVYRQSILEGYRKVPALIGKGLLFFVGVLLPTIILFWILMMALFLGSMILGSGEFREILMMGSPGLVGLLFLILTPYLTGVFDVFLLRIVSGEKKEIRKSLSYTWKRKAILYPLYGIKVILVVIFVLMATLPLFQDFFEQGFSMESWAQSIKNYAIYSSETWFILVSALINGVLYYLSYLFLTVTARIYREFPIE